MKLATEIKAEPTLFIGLVDTKNSLINERKMFEDQWIWRELNLSQYCRYTLIMRKLRILFRYHMQKWMCPLFGGKNVQLIQFGTSITVHYLEFGVVRYLEVLFLLQWSFRITDKLEIWLLSM